jgi:hypothetical protein
MYLFYRYYSKGRWERVPYFRTLCSMSFLLFLHVAALLCFLDNAEILFEPNKNMFILKFTILFAVSLFGFWKIGPEAELQHATYEEQKIKKGNSILIFYCFLAMGLFILSMTFLTKR